MSAKQLQPSMPRYKQNCQSQHAQQTQSRRSQQSPHPCQHQPLKLLALPFDPQLLQPRRQKLAELRPPVADRTLR